MVCPLELHFDAQSVVNRENCTKPLHFGQSLQIVTTIQNLLTKPPYVLVIVPDSTDRYKKNPPYLADFFGRHTENVSPKVFFPSGFPFPTASEDGV
jgi:hypothetical protein